LRLAGTTALASLTGQHETRLSGSSYQFDGPEAIAYDGSHLWITNASGNSVTEINATDGSWVNTLSGGNYGFDVPVGITYDGHLWIANEGGNSVTAIQG